MYILGKNDCNVLLASGMGFLNEMSIAEMMGRLQIAKEEHGSMNFWSLGDINSLVHLQEKKNEIQRKKAIKQRDLAIKQDFVETMQKQTKGEAERRRKEMEVIKEENARREKEMRDQTVLQFYDKMQRKKEGIAR